MIKPTQEQISAHERVMNFQDAAKDVKNLRDNEAILGIETGEFINRFMSFVSKNSSYESREEKKLPNGTLELTLLHGESQIKTLPDSDVAVQLGKASLFGAHYDRRGLSAQAGVPVSAQIDSFLQADDIPAGRQPVVQVFSVPPTVLFRGTNSDKLVAIEPDTPIWDAMVETVTTVAVLYDYDFNEKQRSHGAEM